MFTFSRWKSKNELHLHHIYYLILTYLKDNKLQLYDYANYDKFVEFMYKPKVNY